MLPLASTTRLFGYEKPVASVTTEVKALAAVISWTLLVEKSATKIFLDASTATPAGALNPLPTENCAAG